MARDFDQFLPLSAAALHILLALSSEDRHGYGIMREDRPDRGKVWAPLGFKKEAAEYHEIRVHQLQANLARLSTRGRQIVVDAGHGMKESPDSIITAVRQVVDEVRAENK